MIFKNAKFVCYRNDKMCFDVIVVDGDNEIPYTYLEGNNSPIDIAIKNAVESGELTIAKNVEPSNCGNCGNCGNVKNEENLWSIKQRKLEQLKNNYNYIKENYHIIYNEHMICLKDYSLLNSFYITNKIANYCDMQNKIIKLSKKDIKEILCLILDFLENLMSEYKNLKNFVENAKTREEVENVSWNMEK